MIVRALMVLILILQSAAAFAQTTVQSSSPTLAELLQNLYGPNGLIVES